jgi:matrix metalloproteinase-14 (membrane-inserted)
VYIFLYKLGKINASVTTPKIDRITNLPSAYSLQALDEDSELLESAIKDFQHFAGLELTGKLDAVTLELMKLPRCGVKDTIGTATAETGSRHSRRKRRYAIQGSRWSERRLTWAVNKYTKKISKQQVDQTVKRAFDMWAEASGLEFAQVESSSPKINILFAERYHGDEVPFEGPGGMLAHAQFPEYGGDIHVDNEEPWTLNTDQVRRESMYICLKKYVQDIIQFT